MNIAPVKQWVEKKRKKVKELREETEKEEKELLELEELMLAEIREVEEAEIPREEVREFARKMEARLKKHSHKANWVGLDVYDIYRRIRKNVEDAAVEVVEGYKEKIHEIAVDLGIYAMILWRLACEEVENQDGGKRS